MRPRLLALLGAVLTAAIAIAVDYAAMKVTNGSPLFAVIIISFAVLAACLIVFFLGLVIVPTRVRDAGRHRTFASACILVVAAIVSFCFVWFCFVTWPLGIALLVVAALLFRHSLRHPQPATQ